MKSSKFILISLTILFAACLKSFACGPWAYYEWIYSSAFHIIDIDYSYSFEYNNDKYYKYIDSDDKNILEWQKMVGKNVELWHIGEVVYDFTLIELEKILQKEASIRIFENPFAMYLRENNDKEIVDYLLLARRCELARPKWFEPSDKWWYPSKQDIKVGNDLQSIIDESLAYKGKRLKNRYLLQALRAAFTKGNYDLCFSLWKKNIVPLPNSEIKKMCAGYIGRILFQQGNYYEAMKYYALTDDYESYFWCVSNMAKENTDIGYIKILYRDKPSSPKLVKMVQDICREAEIAANKKDYKEYQQEYLANREQRYIDLRDFALKAAREQRHNNNAAMWQFTAAFLTFLDGDAPLATQYLERAAEMRGTPYVKNSISNFRILADAHTTAQCNSLFESLLPELKALEKVESEPFEKYTDNLWEEIYREPSLWWYPGQSPENSFKTNEMTKITPAYLIPKYLKLKDYTKVLLLAMAANTWTITDSMKYNYSIYSTDVYEWLDVVPVENVIEFQQLLTSGGRNEFERFLLARFRMGKDGNDFLNELIGTKYLRVEKFDKAIPYLSKVSHNYIKNMNLYEYFDTNPFQKEICQKRGDRIYEKPYPTYKLNYAKRMLALQAEIKNTRDTEKKANAMLQYALALKRSTSKSEAWALTDYYLGVSYSYDYNFLRKVIKNEWEKNLLKEADKYLEQAETISKNSETKAECYLAKNYLYYDNGFNGDTYLHLIKNHAETPAVKQLMSECDNFYSYYKKIYKNDAWAYNPEKNR